MYIGYVLFANNKKNLAHSSQIISEPLLLSSTCTTTKVPIRILLGNFCHIHCYCCRCCSCCCCCTIWKKHYQKRKRITAKRTFFLLSPRDFLYFAWIHSCRLWYFNQSMSCLKLFWLLWRTCLLYYFWSSGNILSTKTIFKLDFIFKIQDLY